MSTQQEQPQIRDKPWLFAIEDANGAWKDGEQCVFGDKVSAQDEVDLLNDSMEEKDFYRVVPLYRAAADLYLRECVKGIDKSGKQSAMFMLFSPVQQIRK